MAKKERMTRKNWGGARLRRKNGKYKALKELGFKDKEIGQMNSSDGNFYIKKKRTAKQVRSRKARVKSGTTWGDSRINGKTRAARNDYKKLRELGWSDRRIQSFDTNIGKAILQKNARPGGLNIESLKGRSRAFINKEIDRSIRIAKSAGKTAKEGAKVVVGAPIVAAQEVKRKVGETISIKAVPTAKTTAQRQGTIQRVIKERSALYLDETMDKDGRTAFDRAPTSVKDKLLQELDKVELAAQREDNRKDRMKVREKFYGDQTENALRLRTKLIEWNKRDRADEIKPKKGVIRRKIIDPVVEPTKAFVTRTQERFARRKEQKEAQEARVRERQESKRQDSFGTSFISRLEKVRDKNRAKVEEIQKENREKAKQIEEEKKKEREGEEKLDSQDSSPDEKQKKEIVVRGQLTRF